MNPLNTLLVHVLIVVGMAVPFYAPSPAFAQDCNNNGAPDSKDIDPAVPDHTGRLDGRDVERYVEDLLGK